MIPASMTPRRNDGLAGLMIPVEPTWTSQVADAGR